MEADRTEPPSTSKTQRWLDLLGFLVGRRTPVTVDRIMEAVPAYRDGLDGDGPARDTVRRMFERDKDELRSLGLPIRSERRRHGLTEVDGYRIPIGDFYLPYLKVLTGDDGASGDPPDSGTPDDGTPDYRTPHRISEVTLSEEEARTAISALRQVLGLPAFPFADEARRALRKLTFDLDPALAPEIPLRVLDRPGGADPQGQLDVLMQALRERRRIRVEYHSIGRDSHEDRELEPWGLLFQWGCWYLAGRDPDRDEDSNAARLFRVDRMQGARIVARSADGQGFEVPASFDITALRGRAAWDLSEAEADALSVEVRFLPPASLLARRNRWGVPDHSEADGSEVRRFTVHRPEPFLRWILSFAGEAEIVGPDEARAALGRMADRVRSLYAAGEGAR